jgi:hypothetical protein
VTAALGIPPALVGVWRRESVTLAGMRGLPEGPFETSDVLWFQARSRYADLRVPHAGDASPATPFATAEAFGGRQRWRPPCLRFQHELDRCGTLADDEGELAWEGDTLLECGTFELDGRECTYLERWVRVSAPGPATRVRELRSADGVLEGLAVRVAADELLLRRHGQSVSAVHRVHEARGPRQLASLGDPHEIDMAAAIAWPCIESIGALP